MSQRPAVTAIVVVHRSEACILECLASLEPEVREGRAEVVVVDNASPDRSVARVAERYPWARIERLDRNLGFAGGVNRGFRAGRGDHFLLLNPDAQLRPGTLAGLLAFLDAHPRAALAAPRVRRPSGKLEATTSRRPTFARQVIETLGLFLLARWIPAFELTGLPRNPEGHVAVDVVAGCCMLIPRWAIEKVGEFDERFFMYVEDADWCVRARDAGFDVCYLPSVTVIHERGHGGANEALTLMDGEGSLDYYFRKHRLRGAGLPLRWLRRLHYLSRMVWMTGRWVTRRPGAGREAIRFWRSFTHSFAPHPPPR